MAIQGRLGKYCPVLSSFHKTPFCHHSDNPIPACEIWQLAEKQSNNSITMPIVTLENSNMGDLHRIDHKIGLGKILIVEDMKPSMDLLKKVLSPFEEGILEASNGIEAMNHIAAHKDIKLILLDLNMPSMDGMEFLKEMTELNDGPNKTPILIVSELNWQDAKLAIELGADGYIKKPYKKNDLLEKMTQVLYSVDQTSDSAIQTPTEKSQDNATEENGSPTINNASSLKFLIVDDSTTMQTIITQVVQASKHSIHNTASNGIEALEILKSHYKEIDIITLDVNMPQMNGLETLKAIRENKQYKDIKVLMCTTECESASLVEYVRLGADDFLIKPFSREQLAEKLTSLNKRKKAQQSA